MRYQLLGRSGLRVSEACLGTMTFGEDWGWGVPKDEARKIYDAFREAGGNFLDTANVYTNGSSETLLGEFVRGHRDEVVLATKYTNAAPGGSDPNAGGNHRKSMMQACEASLGRLGTELVDHPLFAGAITNTITRPAGATVGRPHVLAFTQDWRAIGADRVDSGEERRAALRRGLDEMHRALLDTKDAAERPSNGGTP